MQPEYVQGTDEARAGWVVIIPVKPSAIGKSRLVGTGIDRMPLARAIALDTITAAAAATEVSRVIVVTDDELIAAECAQMAGVEVVTEAPASGLNAAIARGAAHTDGTHRAALLGDLPALRAMDLDQALHAALNVDRAVVADAEGTGSTLVTARVGVPWQSDFGTDSFELHRAAGFAPLSLRADSSLRRDVDTLAQLNDAKALGLGPRTRQLVS
ncbi:2-phospho-L-lactate guanylyltransferase [Microbacterium endophyticum]|uniref:2-phospho-L-lactate guanylyltransferase n=1 Tax=Microbacterium endophyticum TaxID=1526412 RepID=A0A7W4YN42_9MICO|nr:2-phospho-L-lactate guanylyltransferase [Microbacterium endophyticum]MBB2975757.1 2-phospho-L-lactate guanylyltransferase [Microbacterium endophyticum]NIK36240.1 2-phospho-L-lactate guanylyltransferase [Microbacterium endophyticum]